MRGDFSRQTFRQERHFSGVRMQQGRVQLDSDWNEQVDIETHLDETTRVDVIGRCGMPEDDAGFEVTPSPDQSDLLLSGGRAYVDGILCENDGSAITVVELAAGQAQLAALVADGRPLTEGSWIAISATGAGPFTARVESVNAAVLEIGFAPALAPADLTSLQSAGDAVVRRTASYLTQPDFPGAPPADISADDGLYLAYLDVWERHITALEDGEIREIALGGPDTASRTQTVWQVKLQRLGNANANLTCATVPDWSTFIDESTALLRARAQPETTATDLCTIPPGAGYRRLENQLYRVEIHDSGSVNNATFVWSRENGSVVVGAQVTDVDEITVTSLGRDDVLGLAPGDWIELTDDTHELGGSPGELLRITSIAGNVLTVDTSSSGSLDGTQYPAGPKVRRWDDPSGARTVAVVNTNDGFVSLEDGVEVRFEAGRHYETGDYWLIPARTANGDVDWPENGASPVAPLARPPEGIDHHYCKLALLSLTAGTWQTVEDCRNLFPPLTDLHGLQAEPGVHVVHIRSGTHDPLANDTDLLVQELARSGIELDCDQEVEPNTLVNKPTLLLTLDLPFPLDPAGTQFWGDIPVGTIPLTLDGIVRVDGKQILWQPTDAVAAWLLGQLRKLMSAAKFDRLLLHLTLKGNFVYAAGDPTLDVDAEGFGVLQGAALDVGLPTGDGRRGGVLDLWFWLRPSAAATVNHAVLVALASGKFLTTQARQKNVPLAIGLIVDRTKLQASLPPGFAVEPGSTLDPATARRLVGQVRLGAATVVQLAVEEDLAGAADLLVAQLREAEIPLEFRVTPIGNLVDAFDEVVRAGFDLLLASQDTVDAIAQLHATELLRATEVAF
jgi:Family of unknown function (DUF6519)